MTPAQWDAHKRDLCAGCRHMGRCPAVAILDKDPTDAQATKLMERLGFCSQYERKPERKKQARKPTRRRK